MKGAKCLTCGYVQTDVILLETAQLATSLSKAVIDLEGQYNYCIRLLTLEFLEILNLRKLKVHPHIIFTGFL